VTAAGTNAPQVIDPFSKDYTGTGASTFSLANQPLSHANSLVLPIGTNNDPQSVLAMLKLPPAAYAMGTPAAYSSNGLAYPANQADLVISNFVSGTNSGTAAGSGVGTNFIVQFQDSGLTQIPYDFYVITNRNRSTSFVTNYVSPTLLGPGTNIYFAGFTWITNAIFYDWREGWTGGTGGPGSTPKLVQAVQIDVSLFNVWMNNTAHNGGSDAFAAKPPQPTKALHAGHNLDSIYVITSVPFVNGQLPAVRITNGKQLPSSSGFSLATSSPLYVWKDYNVQIDSTHSCVGQYSSTTPLAYTYPSALMADSVTILSDSWTDTGKTWTSGGPGATSTTVNAAMLEGIVQSNPNVTSSPIGMNGDYSGGVENFLRLLECWTSNQTLTYNGSIVVLFYSQYATNAWRQTGQYYTAPTRHWAFDLNFNNPSKLPPMTPQMRALIRGNWFAHQ
jgi:hypothetical protein